MKMKKPLLKPLVVIASILFWCAWNLPAQTAPTITTQPASQTNQVGTTVSFSVGATGTGSLLYQWLFNGTYLPNNIITTVAGYGNYGYSGDGGAATSANLYEPNGVAFDGIGNLYIADVFINRVRSLFNIDGWLLPELTKAQQEEFIADPVRYFIHTDDAQANAIFREVEKRQRRRDAA